MAIGLSEQEMEGLGELESESALESELEAPEMFGWGDITQWAGNQWTALNTPGSWQRKALLNADKAILTGGGKALGTALGGEAGGVLGGALGSGVASLLPDKEFEAELEMESEISPVTRVYPDAMMEHLGHAAMEAESEHEAAEHFLPLVPLVASKLVPLAAKALPKIAGRILPRVGRAVARVTPHLTRGVNNLTRTLFRNPRTRPLLPVVPSITRRAVTTIARHAAAGRPVTPQTAIRVLARQNHRVLSNPRIVGSVLRRSNIMDRRYHRWAGIPFGRRYRWRNGVWRPGVIGPGLAGPTRLCPRCGTTTVVARSAFGQCCGPVVVVR
jgi:hypothetical protein